jgi:hypothetical protein
MVTADQVEKAREQLEDEKRGALREGALGDFFVAPLAAHVEELERLSAAESRP